MIHRIHLIKPNVTNIPNRTSMKGLSIAYKSEVKNAGKINSTNKTSYYF